MQVTALNPERRIALFSDNQVGEITRWYTNDGKWHMERPPAPASCDVLHPNGRWYLVDLKDFDRITRH